DNWMNILRQTSINALIALGMLMVLLTGGIDLSVGPVCALTGCVMGVMLKAGVNNVFLLIVAGLAVGVVAGTINGLLFTQLELPHPFVSTMGTRMMFRGLALLITGAAPISGFPDAILFLGYANIAEYFPVGFLLVIIIFIIAGVFLNRTALGRKIYSVGGNKEAARLSGINVKATLNFTYIMSGLMASIAGIILLGRISCAFPLAGETFDMDAIAACVIGGASFLGGKGTVTGTLIGALLIAIIRNGLDLMGAMSDTQFVVIGAVIIGAVFLDVVRTKAEERTRRMAQARALSE
ncbi:MAG TPA: ABC transporter permease, partial [Anaerovoracaceae bacterium]|nr:ABC transporter permease [Anaerovoracaceae bacterium]